MRSFKPIDCLPIVLCLVFSISTHAHGPIPDQSYVRDPRGMALFFEPQGFVASIANSEYFYKVGIGTNYGSEAIGRSLSADIKRLSQMRDEVKAGRLFHAPLQQWFPTPEGNADEIEIVYFVKRLNKKIEALKELQELNEKISRESELYVRSEIIHKGEEQNWIEHPAKIRLDKIFRKFWVRDLIEHANEVAPIDDDLDSEEKKKRPKLETIDRIQTELPKLIWTLEVYRRDPGEKPKVVQQGRQTSDIRIPQSEWFEDVERLFTSVTAGRSEVEANRLHVLVVLDDDNFSVRPKCVSTLGD